ncbi:hypothetical protein JZ751_006456 [Albula glossodonta]|uniref:Uncharacterized protein n=1 Tax=Albula glossodonta TaxID=121402 RepID=A0A8T2MNP5_9TELE|nr:hypothetical protein JZ751_006456 [Albula glossodonta]
MRRGSKEVFMTCLELSRFITTGTLKVLPRENGAPTWKRICSAPLTIHMRRPRKVKKGATSSMKWLESVSKRWNHQGERCM